VGKGHLVKCTPSSSSSLVSLGRKVEIPLWIIIGTYFSPTHKFHFGLKIIMLHNNNNNNIIIIIIIRYMGIKFSHY
jgi:hypothetical protein